MVRLILSFFAASLFISQTVAREEFPSLCEGGSGYERHLKSEEFFFYSVLQGNMGCVRKIIESGMDVDEEDGQDRTALMRAAEKENFPLVKYLVEKKARLNKKDDRGWSALTYSVSSYQTQSQVLTLLLEKSADPNTSDDDGITPLMLAAKHGHVQAIRLLLDHGAKVDTEDDKGCVALCYAFKSKGDHAEGARILINKSTKFTNKDSETGDTLWVQAARQGKEDLFGLMLKKGQAPSQDEFGKILIAAGQSGDEKTVRWIQEQKAGFGDRDLTLALQKAVWAGEDTSVAALLEGEKEGQLGSGDYNLSELLNPAIQRASRETIASLLDHVKDPRPHRQAILDGLYLAIERGYLELTNVFFQRGLKVNIRRSDQWTPLMWAAYCGQQHVVRDFIGKKAELQVKSPQGQTALDLALASGHQEIAQILRQSGAQRGAGGTGVSLSKRCNSERYHQERLAIQLPRDFKVFLKEIAKGIDLDLYVEKITQAFELDPKGFADFLQKHAINLNIPDLNDEPLLTHIAEAGQEALVRILIGIGADRDQAYLAAKKKGRQQAVQILSWFPSNRNAPRKPAKL